MGDTTLHPSLFLVSARSNKEYKEIQAAEWIIVEERLSFLILLQNFAFCTLVICRPKIRLEDRIGEGIRWFRPHLFSSAYILN